MSKVRASKGLAPLSRGVDRSTQEYYGRPEISVSVYDPAQLIAAAEADLVAAIKYVNKYSTATLRSGALSLLINTATTGGTKLETEQMPRLIGECEANAAEMKGEQGMFTPNGLLIRPALIGDPYEMDGTEIWSMVLVGEPNYPVDRDGKPIVGEGFAPQMMSVGWVKFDDLVWGMSQLQRWGSDHRKSMTLRGTEPERYEAEGLTEADIAEARRLQ